jgi:putative lipoprotein
MTSIPKLLLGLVLAFAAASPGFADGSSEDPTASRIAGTWLAEDIGGGGVIDDAQSTLTIAADGTVNGNSGCNGFGGTATIEGDKVTFGPMVGTLMACAEAIMDQERKFYDALDRTASFRIDEVGKLILLDDGGAELARFSAS